MISAIRVARLGPSDVTTRSDPQLHTLSCLFCDLVLKSFGGVARHLHRDHPDRSDFPVLFYGRIDDAVGSAAIAKFILQQIEISLFTRLKMKSVQGRMVTSFKRIAIEVVCPPGAFDSIVQSFGLRPRWTPNGALIVDNVTGETIQRMIGPTCLERAFPTYQAAIDPVQPVKLKWAARLTKDQQGELCRETYYLKLSLVCRSRIAVRRPRVQRQMNL
jgi:hypothetical protein